MDMQLQGNRNQFGPGQTLQGQVTWHSSESIDRLEWTFVWQTQGKGTVDREEIPGGSAEVKPGQGDIGFSLTTPHRPFSLSGKLLSIQWNLEVTAHPSGQSVHLPIIIAPGEQPVRLNQSFSEHLAKRSVIRVGNRK